MKRIQTKPIVLIISLCCMQVCLAQKSSSLKNRMYEKANECYSSFEDIDEDGELDCNIIDETAKGYLFMSGWWPTCGCGCDAEVGAYKDKNGDYTLLHQEYWKCDWIYKLSSDRDLSAVLPEGFGMESFAPSVKSSEQTEYARFYIEAQIPRLGTDTRLIINTVPFGLKVKSSSILTYAIHEQTPNWDGDEETIQSNVHLYGLNSYINTMNSETLDLILNGEFEKMNESALNEIDRIHDGYGGIYTREDIRKIMLDLKKTYDIYTQIEYESITLGWNRETARFFIKEKGERPKQVSFYEFLIHSVYWTSIC